MSDLSTDYSQNKLLNEVSIAVLAMSLKEFRQNAEHIQHLLESSDKLAQSIQDPELGKRINLSA